MGSIRLRNTFAACALVNGRKFVGAFDRVRQRGTAERDSGLGEALGLAVQRQVKLELVDRTAKLTSVTLFPGTLTDAGGGNGCG